MFINIDSVRAGFPSLERALGSRQVAYLDGPGGTQVHGSVITAMTEFMEVGGSNLGGPFASSLETDTTVLEARSAVADLFGADGSEIVFGQNMTSLTYALSRSLARTWNAGDNIILTRLDHDANVSPWIQAANDVGVQVRFVDFEPDNGCALDLGTLDAALDAHTRLVAFTHASNAVGTVPPVAEIVAKAHNVGALTYVDAVHYTPHGLVDVAETGTDFLVASAYKWFGPHTGCLYGRDEILSELEPYKLRPSPDTSPDRWETGTQSFESLAGVAATVNYIASLGEGETRRQKIISGYRAIGEHETVLSSRFLSGVDSIGHVSLFGHRETENRTATFAVDVLGVTASVVARELGDEGCFVWSGDYYAYEVMQRLGKAPEGLVRIGFVHYNSTEEVDRVLDALDRLGASSSRG